MATRDTGTIQSVQRAMRLLSLFAPNGAGGGPQRREWSVGDLARASGLHKSVVARLMATLAGGGFVVQDPVSRAYRIGPEAFAIGTAYEPNALLDQVARPVMEELTAACGHASYLGVPAGDHLVIIVATEGTRSVRVSIPVGERRPLHAGAIGKVLLAGLPDDRVRELVGPGPLPPMTPATITEVGALLAEIADVRRTGVARNREESIVGAGSVAVGIRDRTGRTVAGLGIVYPSHLVPEAEVDGLARTVADAGRRIEQRLPGGVATGL